MWLPCLSMGITSLRCSKTHDFSLIPPFMPPTVTIAICARNAAQHLRQAIPAALAQDYPSVRFQVLVIDNGSTDNTAAVAQRLGATVRHYRRPGVAGARQFAWQSARSELIAYLDADCEPPVNWLRDLVARLVGNPALAAVSCKLLPGRVDTLAERHLVEARVLDTDQFWTRNALQWPFLVTAGMVIRRVALESVGGFDLSLGRASGEDADLCWRLREVGWELDYVPEVGILHHHRATIRAMLKQVYWYGQGSAATFARWRRQLGWRRYTDWGVYRRIGSGLTRAVPALMGKQGYARYSPLLESADGLAFLAGKWRGSLRHRVLFL